MLAITLNLGAKIHAHGCQRPADVVAVEMVRDSIQIFLAKNAIGMNHLVASDAASGYKHDQHAVIRHEQEPHVFDDAACQRRRNENSQAPRNRRKDVACALHHCFGGLRCCEFAANPLAIFRARRCLRCDLLDEEAVCRSGGNAASRGVRLVEIALAFEVSHHVANRRRAERFDVPVRNAARGNRLAGLDIDPHYVGQDLLVPLLLQDCRAHGFLYIVP